jgi:phage protein D/phage baseplate assembly protein gpV
MNTTAAVPQFSVQLNGTPLTRETRNTVSSVHVQQRLSQPSVCELTFAGEGPSVDSLNGASLTVLLGEDQNQLFSGQITAVQVEQTASREQLIRARAYDALHHLRKRQPVRSFAQASVVEIARELVSDLGLSVECQENVPAYDVLNQHRQTDLQFLTSLAQRCGLYLVVQGDVLRLITLEGFGDDLPLAIGESLLEARFELNGDPACRSVRTLAWDPSRMTSHVGYATTARVGRAVLAEASPSLFSAPGEITLTHKSGTDDSQAAALAQAELDARFGREVVFFATADGDTRLRSGARVSIKGVSSGFAGTYVITEANHRIDRRGGYLTEISSNPPVPVHPASSTTTAFGTVSNIQDPDGLGRVRVSLPSVDDLETHWMQVLFPGAGKGKGFITQPDIGDRVLVIFPDSEMTHGVVLGGVYGSEKPFDDGIEGGAVRRYSLVTPGGQKVVLDDAQQKIRLETKDGSFVELAPKKVHLHSVVDLEIEAPGRTIVITAKKVDFRTR